MEEEYIAFVLDGIDLVQMAFECEVEAAFAKATVVPMPPEAVRLIAGTTNAMVVPEASVDGGWDEETTVVDVPLLDTKERAQIEGETTKIGWGPSRLPGRN
jgi:hypothetical protein